MTTPPDRPRTNSRDARRANSQRKSGGRSPGRPAAGASPRPRSTTPNGSGQVCNWYNATSKTCKFGDNCRFQHPGHPGEEARYAKARAQQRSPSRPNSAGQHRPGQGSGGQHTHHSPRPAAPARREGSTRRTDSGRRYQRRAVSSGFQRRPRSASFDRNRRSPGRRTNSRGERSPKRRTFGSKRTPVCRDWLKGNCRFGRECRFSHNDRTPSRRRSASAPRSYSGSSSRSFWQGRGRTPTPPRRGYGRSPRSRG